MKCTATPTSHGHRAICETSTLTLDFEAGMEVNFAARHSRRAGLHKSRRGDRCGLGAQMLQSKAGYIGAGPHIRQLDEVLCTARPDHTFGSFSPFRRWPRYVRLEGGTAGHGPIVRNELTRAE